MSASGRIFLVLLLVAVPPLLVLAILFAFAAPLLATLGRGTTLLLVVLLAVAWAAVMSVVTGRSFGRDVEALIGVAERGNVPADSTSEAQRRLSAALDERNHQLAQLAAHVRAVPITDEAATVARRVVSAVRAVTSNPTWSFAVLQSSSLADLPIGAYAAEGGQQPDPITDLHRWASVADDADSSVVRYSEGAWGAFVVIEVGEEDLVRGVLLAPWEGRSPPSAADRNLLLLIGQHASLALEHALLYARVRRQADELDRMGMLQRDFLRGVTHDLQTPLTSIRAVASELRATSGLDEPAVADLSVIEHQADRLRRMVAQLLAVSRLEAGVLDPEIDVVRVEPLVRRTWTALRADRPFTLDVEGEPHLTIGDSDRVEQVLWALLDNAVKYSQPGTPVEVRLSTSRAPDGALWSTTEVRDHGVGMDGDTRRRAFEQFFRSEVARKMAPDGSGIGLFAAFGLIRAMGGEISVSSSEGIGTVMTIRLPAESTVQGEPEVVVT